MLSPSEVIEFWAGIMGDHAEFMIQNLSYRETYFIATATYYKDAFRSLEAEARCTKDPVLWEAFIHNAFPLLIGFINFKKLVTRKLLQCCIELGLPPTFINHMINEAMEFYRDLCGLISKVEMDPTTENILLHNIWLPDASGHAAAIVAELDPTEFLLVKEAKKFKEIFDHLFIKAIELGQMLERTCLKNGSLQWLNFEVEKTINDFICFLEKIKILRKECKAMGVIDPLLPDHMIREEKYYLLNIQRLQACLSINIK